MLCIIGNMPTYVTNLHRLTGNILSANGREVTRIILSTKLREICANDFVSTYREDRRVSFMNLLRM